MSHTVHQPIALVIDVSPSMAQAHDPAFRPPIDDAQDAIARFANDVRGVTVCIPEIQMSTFNESVCVLTDFEPPENLHPPVLKTGGQGTNLGGAIARALDELQARKDYLKQLGHQVKQPWLVCITDAQPNMNTAPGFDTRLLDLINRKKLLFLPVCVGGYGTYEVLERLSPAQKPIVVTSSGLNGFSFAEFFRYLSTQLLSNQMPTFDHLEHDHE